jgi:hypothetical protein
MNNKLTKSRTGRLKQFRYGSILVSFFLERVSFFHLQHVDWGVSAPHDPQMKRWLDMMAHHGDVPTITYGPIFF